jgi:transcriptional regulator with XRE-family HTH domain
MFRAGRLARGWTQVEAAARLWISQTYVSLIESERRPIPPALFRRARRAMDLPSTALPVGEVRSLDMDGLARAVGGLGYPAFAHQRRRLRLNPAEILVSALASPDLEARLAEALPWVGREFWDLDWDWTVAQAKLRDLQNRLGYVVSQARRLAAQQDDRPAASKLAEVEERLERSRLVREDTLCRESLTQAERRWLASHRPAEARRWNLLTDVVPEELRHAATPSQTVKGVSR